MQEIILNGKTIEIVAGATLGELLAARGFPPETTLIEWNGDVPDDPDAARQRPISAGDKINLFRIVPGG